MFGQEDDHGQGSQMRIFLTGVSCVGKTTIGKKMGELLGVRFFDLDNEIESFFETSIERLQDRFLTMHSFRNEATKALVHLLKRPESRDCVIALPPSGLMGGYLREIKKANGTTVVVTDKPENILERIRFYDIDSRPISQAKLAWTRVIEMSFRDPQNSLRAEWGRNTIKGRAVGEHSGKTAPMQRRWKGAIIFFAVLFISIFTLLNSLRLECTTFKICRATMIVSSTPALQKISN